MALYASWSPGIAFMPAENPANMVPTSGFPWTDIVGLRQSGGATFQGKVGTGNWFHVPIATPVIVADLRAKLIRIFVMFQCGDPNAPNDADLAGANVTDIHVWDGPNRIQMFGPFKLFGEHRFRLDTNNTHVLPNVIDVSFGIEIGVHVQFSQNFPVTFAAAGADFDM